MHTIYNSTHNACKNESKHSEMGPVRQNPMQRTVRSVHVCASHCAQLLHTILHRTDLIIFCLTLQTITIAPMMSIWGKGGGDSHYRTTNYSSVTTDEYRYTTLTTWHMKLSWNCSHHTPIALQFTLYTQQMFKLQMQHYANCNKWSK